MGDEAGVVDRRPAVALVGLGLGRSRFAGRHGGGISIARRAQAQGFVARSHRDRRLSREVRGHFRLWLTSPAYVPRGLARRVGGASSGFSGQGWRG